MLIDRLEHAGHVERVRHPQDRRRVVLTETAAAHTASLTAWLPAILTIDEVCRGLDGAEADFARDLLACVTATIERSGRAAS